MDCVVGSKSEVLPILSYRNQHGDPDIHFCSPQPITTRSSKTMNLGPVQLVVCLFTFQLSLVLN